MGDWIQLWQHFPSKCYLNLNLGLNLGSFSLGHQVHILCEYYSRVTQRDDVGNLHVQTSFRSITL